MNIFRSPAVRLKTTCPLTIGVGCIFLIDIDPDGTAVDGVGRIRIYIGRLEGSYNFQENSQKIQKSLIP